MAIKRVPLYVTKLPKLGIVQSYRLWQYDSETGRYVEGEKISAPELKELLAKGRVAKVLEKNSNGEFVITKTMLDQSESAPAKRSVKKAAVKRNPRP